MPPALAEWYRAGGAVDRLIDAPCHLSGEGHRSRPTSGRRLSRSPIGSSGSGTADGDEGRRGRAPGAVGHRRPGPRRAFPHPRRIPAAAPRWSSWSTRCRRPRHRIPAWRSFPVAGRLSAPPPTCWASSPRAVTRAGGSGTAVAARAFPLRRELRSARASGCVPALRLRLGGRATESTRSRSDRSTPGPSSRELPLLGRGREGAPARGAPGLHPQGGGEAVRAALAGRRGSGSRRASPGTRPSPSPGRTARRWRRSPAPRCPPAPRRCAPWRWSASGWPITSATWVRWATTPDLPSGSPSSPGSRRTCSGPTPRPWGPAISSISWSPEAWRRTSLRRGEASCSSSSSALEAAVLGLQALYDEHPGLQDRFRDAGRLSSQLAERLGAVGLAARASGIGARPPHRHALATL